MIIESVEGFIIMMAYWPKKKESKSKKRRNRGAKGSLLEGIVSEGGVMREKLSPGSRAGCCWMPGPVCWDSLIFPVYITSDMYIYIYTMG